MIVSITRFNVDPDVGLDHERISEVIEVTSRHPGWRGAYVFESSETPGQMVRFTFWDSVEDRDRLYTTDAARAIGLDKIPQGREVLRLVRADDPVGAPGAIVADGA